MRDGIRIAIDVMRRRDGSSDARAPCVVMMTRYWRSFDMRVPQPRTRAFIGPRAQIADELLRRGYAVVVVDARGTGASEGVWLRPWSREELDDYREVVDWIVAQPWSNGRVAATGISYEGTTALLLAASGHPAVKAVAPRSFEFDLYTDAALPGGIFNRAFVRAWSDGAERLDANRVPSFFPRIARLLVRGVRRVDDDREGKQLRNIIARRQNPPVYEAISAITFRGDRYSTQNVTLDDLSVRAHLPALRAAGVPAQVWGSWMDGTTADTVLRLFEALPSVTEGWIGAWDHLGEHHASQLAPQDVPNPAQREQWHTILRFFDTALADASPQPSERLIHYFTMGEERWKSTPRWPPQGVQMRQLFLGPDQTLGDENDPRDGSDAFRLDASASTGTDNRWHAGLVRPVRYGDRAKLTGASVTGTPLVRPLEITGHPEARLFLRVSQEDAALFVYLDVLAPSGRGYYITEGMLRLLHRAVAPGDPTFKREDAKPIAPGGRIEVVIRMLPTSVRLPSGWRVRLTLAGADADTFAPIPGVRSDLTVTVDWGPSSPSALVLPVCET